MALTTGQLSLGPLNRMRRWFALHQCPACGSSDVRRSSIRSRETDAHAFRSPYRCRACNERFWVMSRRTRTATVAAIAGGFCAALIVGYLIVAPADEDPEAGALAPGNEEFEVLKAPATSSDTAADPLSAPAAPTKSPAAAAAPPPAASAAAPAVKSAGRDASQPGARPASGAEPQPLRPPAQPFVK
jgi:hypothetical protein